MKRNNREHYNQMIIQGAKKVETTKTKLIVALALVFALGFMAAPAFAAFDFYLGNKPTLPGSTETNFNGTLNSDLEISSATTSTPYTLRWDQQSASLIEISLVNTSGSALSPEPFSYVGFDIGDDILGGEGRYTTDASSNVTGNTAGNTTLFSAMNGALNAHLQLYAAEAQPTSFFNFHYVLEVTLVPVGANGETVIASITSNGLFTDPLSFRFDADTGHETGAAAVGTKIIEANMSESIVSQTPLDFKCNGNGNGNGAGICRDVPVPELPIGATSLVLALLGFGVLAIRKKLSK